MNCNDMNGVDPNAAVNDIPYEYTDDWGTYLGVMDTEDMTLLYKLQIDYTHVGETKKPIISKISCFQQSSIVNHPSSHECWLLGTVERNRGPNPWYNEHHFLMVGAWHSGNGTFNLYTNRTVFLRFDLAVTGTNFELFYRHFPFQAPDISNVESVPYPTGPYHHYGLTDVVESPIEGGGYAVFTFTAKFKDIGQITPRTHVFSAEKGLESFNWHFDLSNPPIICEPHLAV